MEVHILEVMGNAVAIFFQIHLVKMLMYIMSDFQYEFPSFLVQPTFKRWGTFPLKPYDCASPAFGYRWLSCSVIFCSKISHSGNFAA